MFCSLLDAGVHHIVDEVVSLNVADEIFDSCDVAVEGQLFDELVNDGAVVAVSVSPDFSVVAEPIDIELVKGVFVEL